LERDFAAGFQCRISVQDDASTEICLKASNKTIATQLDKLSDRASGFVMGMSSQCSGCSWSNRWGNPAVSRPNTK
jgi:hypothetical protein